MKSIGSKIQTALIGSISILAVCAFIVLLVNQINAANNREIINRMVSEYSIISLSEDMVQAYYDFVIRGSGRTQESATYQTLKTKIPIFLPRTCPPSILK